MPVHADSAMVHINRSELEQLCILRMVADPTPANVNVDIAEDFLDRAAAELGFTDWVDAFHMNQPRG